METVYSTENKLIRATLFKKDGSNLPVSQISVLKAILYAGGVYKKTLTYGSSPELRLGNATNEIEIEITKAIMLELSYGEISIKIRIEITDSEFTVDGVQVDEQIYKVFNIV